jgi:hypothetical protein
MRITAHENLVQAYEPKFPDLAEHVLDPKAYKDAVLIIRNETDITKIDLSSILSPNHVCLWEITVHTAIRCTDPRFESPSKLTINIKMCFCGLCVNRFCCQGTTHESNLAARQTLACV